MNQKEIQEIANELPEIQRQEYLNLVEQITTVLHGATKTARLLALGAVGQKMVDELDNETKS